MKAIEEKELYHFITHKDKDINCRLINLFTRDLLKFKGKIISFDDANARLTIDESGIPFLELSLDKTGRHSIPMVLEDNKYYSHLLLEMAKKNQNFYGSILFANTQLGYQSCPIYAYFVVNIEDKWIEGRDITYVGIDTNLYYPTWFSVVDSSGKIIKVGKFPTYQYNGTIENIQERIRIIQKKEGYNNVCKKLYNDIHLVAKNKWGDFISSIEKVLPENKNVVFVVEDPKMLLRFGLPKNKRLRSALMQKWHMGLLPAMLESKGYRVMRVNPAYTSKTCHKCGAVNKELKGSRQFVCPSCGMTYNRDLNAAINIGLRGKTKWAESIEIPVREPIQLFPALSLEPSKVA